MKSIAGEIQRASIYKLFLNFFRVLLAILPLLATLGLWMLASARVQATNRMETIRARELRLVDSQGKQRAVLNLVNGSAGLSFQDQDGVSRLDLLVEPKDEPVIWLMDGNALGRADLSLTLGRYPEMSWLAPLEPGERALLGVDHKGVGYLSIFEGKRSEFWIVPHSDSAPSR